MEHRSQSFSRKSTAATPFNGVTCHSSEVGTSVNSIRMKRSLRMLVIALPRAIAGAEEIKDFGRDRLNSSPRHAEWVDIKSGDRTIKAFVVYPERKDKAPAVLVIQEIFGLTDWLRSMCDELAEIGVIAIAPDFLNGQKFEDARRSPQSNLSGYRRNR